MNESRPLRLEPISNCCGIIFLHERHEKHEKRENFVFFVSFVEENENFSFCSFRSKKKYALNPNYFNRKERKALLIIKAQRTQRIYF